MNTPPREVPPIKQRYPWIKLIDDIRDNPYCLDENEWYGEDDRDDDE